MSDGRRRRRAKQARRDTRRSAAYERNPSDDKSVVGLIRGALAKGHPLGLLTLASYMIWSTDSGPLARTKSPPQEPLSIDNLLASFIGEKRRETTALLAVLAEMIVDDPDRQTRCRKEVAKRKHSLPKWISGLPDIQICRAVRATHVLGDFDQLIIGTQLAGRYDMTCMVRFDHNTIFEVDGIDFMSGWTDELVASAIERNPDFTFVDMSLAEGAWLRRGLDRPLFPHRSDRWPETLPLVKWLVAHLPDGREEFQRPEWDGSQLSELFRAFFATPTGAPFDDYECRSMLYELVESGNGDPLRWSITRIDQLLDGSPFHDRQFELQSVLEVPDLLSAFVRFAHAQSGVRDEFTAEALAFIAKKGRAFRKEVLANVS